MKSSFLLRLTTVILTGGQILITSCGEQSDTTAGSTADESNGVSTTTTETEETARLELEARDFDGRTFTFLTDSWGSYSPLNYVDIQVDESNGDILNDKAYERNSVMAEKYNCSVEIVNQASDGDGMTHLSQAVLAGDDTYDIVMIRGRQLAKAITDDLLCDIASLPHIDTDQPWWDSGFCEAMTLGGKNHVLVGYTSTNYMNAIWTVCFNKRLIDEYQLDDPYKLVSDGKWTFDKAIEMSVDIAGDVNGDTIMDENDRWGINHTNDTVIGILNSCGVDIAEVDSDGLGEFTIDTAKSVERIGDIFTKLFNEAYAMDTLCRDTMRATDMDGQFFAQGNVLFLFTATHLIWQLRQMDVDFGMLPYPKYSEAEDYSSSTAGIFLSMTGVPASNTELDDTGYFLEAYAYEGWRLLKPAFYENVLMGKLARDDESKDTLEYIYGNLRWDVGNLLSIGNFPSTLAGMSADLNTDIASFLAQNLPVVEGDLVKFNDSISD